MARINNGLAAMTVAVIAALACPDSVTPVSAQISGDTIKIGLLTDMSGVYADISGQGGVEAAAIGVPAFEPRSVATDGIDRAHCPRHGIQLIEQRNDVLLVRNRDVGAQHRRVATNFVDQGGQPVLADVDRLIATVKFGGLKTRVLKGGGKTLAHRGSDQEHPS